MRNLSKVTWADRYRPTTLADCWLPSTTRAELNEYISEGVVRDLFFSGKAGIGKTTTALALVNDLGGEKLVINGSMQNGIDVLRTTILDFASTVSFDGGRKYVIIDEADALTPAMQSGFRGFRDEFSSNISVILTANYENKIIDPIRSRLTRVEFNFPQNELPVLAKAIFGFVTARLTEEERHFEPRAVAGFISDYLKRSTDIRQLLLQMEAISKRHGEFTETAVLSGDINTRFSDLITAVKHNNFTEIRTWVGVNSDIEATVIFRRLYDHLKELGVDGIKLVQVIDIINKHQYQQSFVADAEINITSCILEVAVTLND